MGKREKERRRRQRGRKIRSSIPSDINFRNLLQLSSKVREQSARGSKYQKTTAQLSSPSLPRLSPRGYLAFWCLPHSKARGVHSLSGAGEASVWGTTSTPHPCSSASCLGKSPLASLGLPAPPYQVVADGGEVASQGLSSPPPEAVGSTPSPRVGDTKRELLAL